jgi:dipeptidyl aminopeptidase/acylaminoacyl peptidase
MMNRIKREFSFCLVFSLFCIPYLRTQERTPYMVPPAEITSIVEAPLTPVISIQPQGGLMILMDDPGMPGIGDLASEELRLAGVRFNPATNGRSRESYYTGISVLNIDGTSQQRLKGLPFPSRINNIRWSPDGRKIAFLNTLDDGIELWVADVVSAEATRLTGLTVNNVLGNPFTWLAGSETLIYTAKVAGRPGVPLRPAIPAGPVVQENIGAQAPARTFQDLLGDSHDEDLFEYYATAPTEKGHYSTARKPLSGNLGFTGASVLPPTETTCLSSK